MRWFLSLKAKELSISGLSTNILNRLVLCDAARQRPVPFSRFAESCAMRLDSGPCRFRALQRLVRCGSTAALAVVAPCNELTGSLQRAQREVPEKGSERSAESSQGGCRELAESLQGARREPNEMSRRRLQRGQQRGRREVGERLQRASRELAESLTRGCRETYREVSTEKRSGYVK